MFLPIIAGLLFGSYLIPLKTTVLSPLEFLFPMSVGIAVFAAAIFLIKKPIIDKKIIANGIASGILWNTANITSFFAVGALGLTVGFPLTQMALFVSVLWGIFYFREIKGKNAIVKVIGASIILFCGVILLSLTKL